MSRKVESAESININTLLRANASFNPKNFSLKEPKIVLEKIFVPAGFTATILTACAPTPSTPVTPETPTGQAVLITSTPEPTQTPTPSPTPSPEPSPTPSPTPEKITLEKTFGLTGDALKAFRGAERAITRAENGGYLVTAQVRNPETGELEEIQLILDPASFDTHPEITNPLGLYTVQAFEKPKKPTSIRTHSVRPDFDLDDEILPSQQNEPQPVTLLWLPETREFRLAYDLQPLYDDVNTDTPTFNPEAHQNAPTFTVGDIQSGFAVRNLLLTFSQQMAEGKTLKQLLYADPAATRNAWTKLGGNSLFFEMGSNNDRYAYLKAKGDDVEYSQIHYNAETMKYLPFAAKINLEGKEYFGFYVANFDPVDFDPSHPEQGADPTDIKNWKFFFTLPVHISNYDRNLDPGNTTSDGLNPSPAQYMKEKGFFRRIKNPTPWLIIYADENARSLHPLLAQLLQIKENDASKLDTEDGEFYLKGAIQGGIRDLGVLANVLEMPIPQGVIIPPELQLILFLSKQ